jgi:hypothetical protein
LFIQIANPKIKNIMSVSQVKMQTNGSLNGGVKTNGMLSNTQSQPQFATYTQGIGTDWYYELIHSSKKRINKINTFMHPYETNGRDVDPEVTFLLSIENLWRET